MSDQFHMTLYRNIDADIIASPGPRMTRNEIQDIILSLGGLYDAKTQYNNGYINKWSYFGVALLDHFECTRYKYWILGKTLFDMYTIQGLQRNICAHDSWRNLWVESSQGLNLL